MPHHHICYIYAKTKPIEGNYLPHPRNTTIESVCGIFKLAHLMDCSLSLTSMYYLKRPLSYEAPRTVYTLWNNGVHSPSGKSVVLKIECCWFSMSQLLKLNAIRLVQLWRSSRHSRLPHGREQQSIEQPALPAGRMYSLLKADLEYIKSIAINSLLIN